MVLPFEPGKLTEEVKTHIPDTTKFVLGRKATQMGMTLSQYLRDLICIDAHGLPYDELMLAHRRKVRAADQGRLSAQAQASVGPDEAQTTQPVADIQS